MKTLSCLFHISAPRKRMVVISTVMNSHERKRQNNHGNSLCLIRTHVKQIGGQYKHEWLTFIICVQLKSAVLNRISIPLACVVEFGFLETCISQI